MAPPTRYTLRCNTASVKNQIFLILAVFSQTRVTSGGARLRGLAPGLHSSEEMPLRWRAVDDTASDSVRVTNY